MSKRSADAEKSPESSEAGYERQDVPPVWVVTTAFLGILFVWVLLGCCAHFLQYLRRSEQSSTGVEASVLEKRALPPPPRIQEHPETELKSYLTKEKEILSTYAWVDKGAGVARIPINRAMEILAHEPR